MKTDPNYFDHVLTANICGIIINDVAGHAPEDEQIADMNIKIFSEDYKETGKTGTVVYMEISNEIIPATKITMELTAKQAAVLGQFLMLVSHSETAK